MPKIYAACPCYYANAEKASRLIDSCSRHGFEMHPFGIGDQWRGTVGGETYAGFCALPPIIRSLPAEYDLVLYSDCSDVFVTGGEAEIREKFMQATRGVGVLLSAETEFYPPAEREFFEDNALNHSPTKWRYQNGGGFIGTRDAMADTLDWLWTHYTESMEGMFRWSKILCDSTAPKVTLDGSCSIFQTMSGQGSASLDWNGGRPINTVTGESPVLLHWNGRLGGIEEAWVKVYG